MNLIEEFNKGQIGANKGIPFGRGLEKITMDLFGIHKGRIYGVGGPEKSGKSTFTDYAFILEPYLYSIEHNTNVDWVYYSFEIDRISKEFDFMAFFLSNDYDVQMITLPAGITVDGKSKILLSPDYLRGYVLDDAGGQIKVDPNLIPLIKEVYYNRIIPLFGEFDSMGNQISPGRITFKEGRENPTGVYKDLLKIAEQEGVLVKDNFKNPVRYIPNDPAKMKIIVIDHIRKLKPERGFQMKQTIDKMSEYMVVLVHTLIFMLSLYYDYIQDNKQYKQQSLYWQYKIF